MKKGISMIVAAILVIAMVLSFASCGQSEAAKAADALIAAIGEVGLGSGDAITAAESAVAALEQKDKDSLKNLEILTQARQAFDEAVDLDKIGAVEALINGIGTVTRESGEVISAAREAYDGLEDNLKKRVPNAAVLTEAEENLRKAELDYYSERAETLANNVVKISEYFDDLYLEEADELIDKTLPVARELAALPITAEIDEINKSFGMSSISEAIETLENVKELVPQMCSTDTYVVRYEYICDYPTSKVESGADFFSYGYSNESYALLGLATYKVYLDKHFKLKKQEGFELFYDLADGREFRAKTFVIDSWGVYAVFVIPPVMTKDEQGW